MQALAIAAHLTGVSVGLHAGFTRWGLLASGNGFPLRALLEEAVEHCETALPSEDPVLATLIAGPGRQPPRTPIRWRSCPP